MSRVTGQRESWPGAIVSVRRVADDVTVCRRCNQPVQLGRRVAFVAGTGNVCMPCLVRQSHDDTERKPA